MNVLDVDFASLTHAVATYGYPVLFALIFVASAGAPLPVGILLAALGAASVQHGGPDFAVLIASGVVASVVGDGVDFGIGRTGGRRAVRWAQARLRSSRAFGSTVRYRATPDESYTRGRGTVPRLEAMVFLSRFALTALATPASLLAGATGMTVAAFLFWDTAGEAVFVVGNLTLGRVLSASGLSSGPLMLVLGALAVATYVAIWLIGRLGHRGHWEREEHERQAGLPAVQAQVAAAAVTGSCAASTQAPRVVACRRIVCAVRSAMPNATSRAMPRAACGTG